MSATRLLVLGVVRIFGQAHGYQVRRELLSWSVDQWANVKPGSLYHALKQLAKQQLLEEVTTEGGGVGPERTIYRLTPDGETEFMGLLTRSLSQLTRDTELFNAAYSFLTVLPRARAIALLNERATQLSAHVASAKTSGTAGIPQHTRDLFQLWRELSEANLRWTEHMIAQLEAGEYVMAGESPAQEDS